MAMEQKVMNNEKVEKVLPCALFLQTQLHIIIRTLLYPFSQSNSTLQY